MQKHDLDAAERAYRHALDADPKSAEAMYSVACVFSHRRDFEAGLLWARRALAADPAHANAHRQIGNSLLGLERHAEALEALEIAYRAAPSAQVRAQMALCCE